MLAGIGFQKSKKTKERNKAANVGYFGGNIAEGGSDILNENDTK